MQVGVLFDVVNERSADIFVGTCLMNRNVRGIFFALCLFTVKKSKSLCMIAMERENNSSTNSIASTDVSTVAGNPPENEVHALERRW